MDKEKEPKYWSSYVSTSNTDANKILSQYRNWVYVCLGLLGCYGYIAPSKIRLIGEIAGSTGAVLYLFLLCFCFVRTIHKFHLETVKQLALKDQELNEKKIELETLKETKKKRGNQDAVLKICILSLHSRYHELSHIPYFEFNNKVSDEQWRKTNEALESIKLHLRSEFELTEEALFSSVHIPNLPDTYPDYVMPLMKTFYRHKSYHIHVLEQHKKILDTLVLHFRQRGLAMRD